MTTFNGGINFGGSSLVQGLTSTVTTWFELVDKIKASNENPERRDTIIIQGDIERPTSVTTPELPNIKSNLVIQGNPDDGDDSISTLRRERIFVIGEYLGSKNLTVTIRNLTLDQGSFRGITAGGNSGGAAGVGGAIFVHHPSSDFNTLILDRVSITNSLVQGGDGGFGNSGGGGTSGVGNAGVDGRNGASSFLGSAGTNEGGSGGSGGQSAG
ncbi:MAG: hypothetical protein HC918_07085, partial [Oscillatoriales cyanobacterium SM2_1_8]|nr:hypothetical protein [Oscillatoriales cyanobacterium SM2_1_8]